MEGTQEFPLSRRLKMADLILNSDSMNEVIKTQKRVTKRTDSMQMASSQSSLLSPLLIFCLFSLLQSSAIAAKKSYIVYLGAHSHGLNPSALDVELATRSHYDMVASLLGSQEKAEEAIFYSYNRYINGFAAMFDEEEAEIIARQPNVVSVFLNKGRKLHTTRTWDFLRLESNGEIHEASAWKKARFGEDTIIGNLDTGVWPESKSFSDEGLGPVPSRWKGICQTQSNVRCNKKLIGARFFIKGFESYAGKLNATYHTVRDSEGHGSHTLSTAGGSFVSKASVFGNGNGTAKGGSPKARVAAYKVCWPPIDGNQCFDSDILAGFEAAIGDGVDVLSVSLGGGATEFFEDGIAIGSFHAMKNGIVVVSSAGNSGPTPGSVSNVAPWMLTVGASTIDRDFTSYVGLGNKKHLRGASISDKNLPARKFYPLISAADAKAANQSAADAKLCSKDSLDPKKAKGKIVLCLRGGNGRVEKGYNAAAAGAVGMILANDEANGNEIIADTHLIPATHLSFNDGQSVFAYVNSTKSPKAYITNARTEVETEPAPFMAAFSSRGPNTVEEAILKPDITAPGVNVIAAYTEGQSPTELEFDKRRIPFNVMSGTSMSCPHVSGIVGLLKTLHPDWSPAAIKSAVMTTARTRDNKVQPMLDSTMEKATPFAYGSGHVRPNRAMAPGLVYDLSVEDYLNFLCARGYGETYLKLFANETYACPKSFNLKDFNYPSISIPVQIKTSVTVTRTVKNVGTPGTYVATVKAPHGISVSVSPKTLTFEKVGEEKKFRVVFKSRNSKVAREDYGFGSLTWSDGKHYVRSPIAVKLS